jgi:uncharacterized protein YebE (UPF0316 family)
MDWDAIVGFFTAAPWWELAIIFVAKIVEVSLGTVRMILVNKGYRNQSVLLALVEIIMWVFVASTVITDLTNAPIKGIVYSLGFASGVYMGSIIETKLAFGMSLIEAIASEKTGLVIADRLREIGYGVTTIIGQGRNEKRVVVKVIARRRQEGLVIRQILNLDPAAMVVSEDIKTVTGGYMARSRSLFK